MFSSPAVASSPRTAEPSLGWRVGEGVLSLSVEEDTLFGRVMNFQKELIAIKEESKKLVNPNLSKAEVEKIAFQKGGYSALLFRSILKHPIIVDEEKALYQLGAVGQVLDDLFDLWCLSKARIKLSIPVKGYILSMLLLAIF